MNWLQFTKNNQKLKKHHLLLNQSQDLEAVIQNLSQNNILRIMKTMKNKNKKITNKQKQLLQIQ